ncbi:hypothetical protein [Streptomyces sp. 5-10]|uniref:hypothetical protein n=1 Tax=Streptomyces sp. 5-10 TaxID=878925 RepID=UPI00168C0DD5|nr:hypothetical protein [Streptomyces sp. 5-10]MBD3004662.1 hypothetical protein [Streptomyces sp. 5-10]
MSSTVELSAEKAAEINKSVDVIGRLKEIEPVAREVIRDFRSSVVRGQSKGATHLWASRIYDTLKKADIHAAMYPSIPSIRLEMTSPTAVLVQLERDLSEVLKAARTAARIDQFGTGIHVATDQVERDLDHLEAHLREIR